MSASVGSRSRTELLRAPVILGASGLAAASLLYVRDPHGSGSYGYCPFLALTGMPCPGCGGLRAVNDLTHGDVVSAISSNALVVLAGVTLGALWVLWFVRRWKGQPGGMLRVSERGGYAVLAVAVAFGILRNTPWGSWLAP